MYMVLGKGRDIVIVQILVKCDILCIMLFVTLWKLLHSVVYVVVDMYCTTIIIFDQTIAAV